MVKNLKGGTGHRKLARKNENRSHNHKLRVPEDELEIFGCVTKMFGNGMCQIITNDNTTLMGHIRGSFRGKQKRHNNISTNCLVLIGLREWETTPKNCDILTIYTDSDIEQIKNIPNINIEYLLSLRTGSHFNNKESVDINFYETIEDDEFPKKIQSTTVNSFKINDVPDVDVDDI